MKKITRYSWDGNVIGYVKVHDSALEVGYLGDVWFLPKSMPITHGTHDIPPRDAWKFGIAARWLCL